ncbi:MAG: CHAT domain-containing protein [Pedobacter sp.]|nr:MAG: CHAT domain-containing protein [Pedobacter sp.]
MKFFVSKSGKLHFLNISALMISKSTNFRCLISTSELLRGVGHEREMKVSEAFVYGGIDYDRQILPSDGVSELVAENIRQSTYWSFLPGALEEANYISQVFESSAVHVNLKSGPAATEFSVRQLSSNQKPFFLHLATHGFINLAQPDEMALIRKEDWDESLSRAGMVFSGANTTRYTGINNGILTGSEVATLDLRKCHLVVLSACQSGLGDVIGNEGVYGLQRAFKLAGVSAVISALWEIPDLDTKNFMVSFYGYLISSKSIPVAFRKAQMEAMQTMKPYSWAGFVLIE